MAQSYTEMFWGMTTPIGMVGNTYDTFSDLYTEFWGSDAEKAELERERKALPTAEQELAKVAATMQNSKGDIIDSTVDVLFPSLGVFRDFLTISAIVGGVALIVYIYKKA